MELIILKRDSESWNYAWDWLKAHPMNAMVIEPSVAENNGEVWQYMGSWLKDGKLISDFRHRNHPITGNRHSFSIAHPSYKEEDIEKRSKIS